MAIAVKKTRPLLSSYRLLFIIKFLMPIRTRSWSSFVTPCSRASCIAAPRTFLKKFYMMCSSLSAVLQQWLLHFKNVTLFLLAATYTKILWLFWISNADELSRSKLLNLASKLKYQNSTLTLIPSKYRHFSLLWWRSPVPMSTLVNCFLFWLLQHHQRLIDML